MHTIADLSAIMIHHQLMWGAIFAIAYIDSNVNTATSMSFLPRRGCHSNNNPFTMQRPHINAVNARRRCISVVRGGSQSNYADDKEEEEEAEQQSTQSLGMEGNVEDDNAVGDSGAATIEQHDVWEEEIRRTRQFYGASRSSPSQTDNNNILITGTSSANYDDEAIPAEDERVFGSAQTTAKGVEEKDTVQKVEEPETFDDKLVTPPSSSKSHAENVGSEQLSNTVDIDATGTGVALEISYASVNEAQGLVAESHSEDYTDNDGRKAALKGSQDDNELNNELKADEREDQSAASSSSQLADRTRDDDEQAVPYVINREMERVLLDEEGYDPLELQEMRPIEALDTPRGFYNDIEPAVATDNGKDDKSLKRTFTSLIREIRKKVSTGLVAVRWVVSLGVVLSLFLRPNRGNRKIWEGSAGEPTSEFPSASISSELLDTEENDLGELLLDDTLEPQPDDLDNTLIDKLISFISKHFGA